MIIRLLLVAGLLQLSSAFANAQGSIPEFKDKVLSVTKENTLSDLDNTDMQSELNTNMGGSSKINLKAMGKTASVQSATGAEYIIRLEPGIDPEGAVELFEFDVDKKNRKINVAAYAMGKAKDVELPKKKLKFTKVQDGVYKIAPIAPLEAGEYVFLVNRPSIDIMGASSGTRLKGFAFSVK